AKEVKEETVVDAIEFAHTEIKKICAAISELRDKVGKKKREVTAPEFDERYWRTTLGCTGHREASQGRKLRPDQGDQEGTACSDPRRGRRSAEETQDLLRNPART